MASNNIAADLDSYKIKCHAVSNIDCCKSFLTSDYNFKVLSFNIRSINKNFDNFVISLQRLKLLYDVIILNECWLSEHSQIPLLQNYTAYKTTKIINQNGGVVMYVRDGLCVTVSEPPIDEANCLQLIVDKKVCILGIYRSPSFRNPSMFLTSLDRHLTSLNNQYIVLAGDININILESSDSPWWQEYLCLVSEFDLAPAITLPTRQGSCLDHIFVKSNKAVIGVVCESDISDHDIVMVGMRLGKVKVRNAKRYIFKRDIELIKSDLNLVNWQSILDNNNLHVKHYLKTLD
ncbi:unnamed protein product [Colias eurytheme]|nr:unnamed protein product [Colias eurytheme]